MSLLHKELRSKKDLFSNSNSQHAVKRISVPEECFTAVWM